MCLRRIACYSIRGKFTMLQLLRNHLVLSMLNQMRKYDLILKISMPSLDRIDGSRLSLDKRLSVRGCCHRPHL